MQKITQCWLILEAFLTAGPGTLWEPPKASWLCCASVLGMPCDCSIICPTMNGCCCCLKELIERISGWTPLPHELRWVISSRVYPLFSEMSCLTLIPGRPGPPSCPRSPAGPLGPGGPGLPRSPAGPWKEMWRSTARESALNLKLPIQIHMDSPKVWRSPLEEDLYLFTWKSIATG